jgi:hypothetical protein
MDADSSVASDGELDVLERVEISDDEDDDFDYAEIDDEDGDLAYATDDEDEDEDLGAALASLREKSSPSKQNDRGSSAAAAASASGAAPLAVTQVRPSVVDDFIRNFLINVGMGRTLDSFNTEWYELQSKGKLSEQYTSTVPDIYLRNQELDEQVQSLRSQLVKMREITAKAQGTWDKFRKERDFHRMHHKRVVQEKGKLMTDLKRLRKHYMSYEPTLKELQRKYEVAMKEKMLMRLERYVGAVAAAAAAAAATMARVASAAPPALLLSPPRHYLVVLLLLLLLCYYSY